VTTLEIQTRAPRASDAERDQAIDLLRLGAAEGRISHETFLVRMEAALSARRRGELRDLTADLPVEERRPGQWLIDVVSRVATLRNRLHAAWGGPQMPRLLLPAPAPYPLRIGRGEGCDLGLANDSVSRVHAELLYLNGIWILRDLRSTNGTTVNGWRIKTDVAVRPGDVVGFGEMLFVLGSR